MMLVIGHHLPEARELGVGVDVPVERGAAVAQLFLVLVIAEGVVVVAAELAVLGWFAGMLDPGDAGP